MVTLQMTSTMALSFVSNTLAVQSGEVSGAGTSLYSNHLAYLLQRQAHNVGDDDPLLGRGPAVHPHQDDVVK